MQCYWVYHDIIGIWTVADKIPPYGIRYWFCDVGDKVYVVDNGLKYEGEVDSMDKYQICIRAGSIVYFELYLINFSGFMDLHDNPRMNFGFIPAKTFERYHDLTCPNGYLNNGWDGVNNSTMSIRLAEPPCTCKYLLDGHDQNCQYIKWKRSKV